jgi:hypothetical protein
MRDETADPNLIRFSFWKPEPLPPKNASILPVELLSLGALKTVTARLLDIPKMEAIPAPPWQTDADENLTLHWGCDAGVLLRVHVEQGPPKQGEILTIDAQSKTPDKVFFKLYVQIFEQFGATVLDERTHEFFTPKEFRTRMAG